MEAGSHCVIQHNVMKNNVPLLQVILVLILKCNKLNQAHLAAQVMKKTVLIVSF